MTNAGRRVVAVTGAGTGIGREVARASARAGEVVVAVGRRPAPLQETASGLPTVHPLAMDVTADGAAGRLVSQVEERHGRLDVLVNNAAIVRTGPLADVDPGDVAAQVSTNLVAPTLLTRAALPLLVASRGVVVNVTTAIGQRAWPGSSVYAATKVALESLTRSWAVELAGRGVRVVAVAPGAVRTPIGEHQGLMPEQVEEVRRWQAARTPLGRIAEPAEIAWAVRTLASDEASFVTGTVLAVDGGAVVA